MRIAFANKRGKIETGKTTDKQHPLQSIAQADGVSGAGAAQPVEQVAARVNITLLWQQVQ
jgi:hypothetical protein